MSKTQAAKVRTALGKIEGTDLVEIGVSEGSLFVRQVKNGKTTNDLYCARPPKIPNTDVLYPFPD